MSISLSQFARDIELAKATVFRKCQELGINTSEGLTLEDCDRLRQAFGIAQPSVISTPVQVETGNHAIVLSAPHLPQSYSLEPLRNSESVSFEDPLAIAQQFLQGADQLKFAMESDIQERQRRLDQTKAAQDAIARKAQELTLEARLYKLQTETLDSALTKETQTLSESLQQLQSLGKPTVDGSQSPS